MLQGIMTQAAFQFLPDAKSQVLFPYSIILQWFGLIFIFFKFNMITSVKELNVLKQYCNSLNVSHSACSKKSLCWTGRQNSFPAIKNNKKSVKNVQKLLQICSKVLEMKQLSFPALNIT
jgi:hypothetical protein